MFERFHRGHAGRSGPPGDGLGLPIARELTRAWGGEVTTCGRAGGGAIATLSTASVPAAEGGRPASEDRDEFARVSARRGYVPGQMTRKTLIWTSAALLGIVLTAALAWSASQLAGQRIGLSSEPLSALGSLAPPPAARHTAPAGSAPRPPIPPRSTKRLRPAPGRPTETASTPPRPPVSTSSAPSVSPSPAQPAYNPAAAAASAPATNSGTQHSQPSSAPAANQRGDSSGGGGRGGSSDSSGGGGNQRDD